MGNERLKRSFSEERLTQALGNLVETVWWGCWKGWPSDWPRSHAHGLLAPQQLSILPAKVRAAVNLDCPDDASTLDRKHWFSITRQIYAAVKKAGQAERIDVFNATYGLFRGTVSALIVIAAAAIFGKSSQALLMSIGCLVGIGLGFFRMHRFAVHYARELFVQFLGTLAPEARLLEIIDTVVYDSPAPGSWEGTAIELERKLTNDSSKLRREAALLFSFPLACGTYLGRLHKLCPERFEPEHTNKGNRWTINPPEK